MVENSPNFTQMSDPMPDLLNSKDMEDHFLKSALS